MADKNDRYDLVFRALSDGTEVTLSSVIGGFLLSLELENRTAATLTYNRKILKNFQWYCDQNELPTDLKDINGWHIKNFLAYVQTNPQRWGNPKHSRANKPAKASTVARYRAVLHCMWNWAIREELTDHNPVDKTRPPKMESRIIEPLNDAEIKALLNACKSGNSENKRRDLAIMLLMLDTGLRASELCGLKLDSWDQSRRIKVYGKGRKERCLSLSAYTAKALWDYIQRERGDSFFDELFLGKEGKPLTWDALRRLLERRAAEAKIRHIHPHLMRHTFAFNWARAGGPLHALQTLMGHERPDMSLRYGRMASTDAAELHKQYSPIERLNLRFRDKK